MYIQDLLYDPEPQKRFIEYLAILFGKEELIEMLVALKDTLQQGGKLKYITCPKCFEIHVDKGEFSKRKHRTHLCLNCNKLFKDPEEEQSFGNPLVLYDPVLIKDKIFFRKFDKSPNNTII